MKQTEYLNRDRAARPEWTRQRLMAEELKMAKQAETAEREHADNGLPRLAASDRVSARASRERASLLLYGARNDYERGRAAYHAMRERNLARLLTEDADAIISDLPRRAQFLDDAAGARVEADLFAEMASGATPIYIETDEEQIVAAQRARRAALLAQVGR